MAQPDLAGARRFEQAVEAIDAYNAQDARREAWQDRDYPTELLYSQRMSAQLERFEPDASDALRLAVHAQHIGRWTSPRESYPMDRAGYKSWRSDLGRFHADKTAELLADCGYRDELIDRVRSLLTKKQLKVDPECQTLEDVACLVFLEHYFDGFAEGHDEDTLVRIVRRTWLKMSDRGHQAALALELSPRNAAIVGKATAGGPTP